VICLTGVRSSMQEMWRGLLSYENWQKPCLDQDISNGTALLDLFLSGITAASKSVTKAVSWLVGK